MKHNTKATKGAQPGSKTRMIGLRLDPATMQEIERLAIAEERSLADMARICVRHGMRHRAGLAPSLED